MNKTFRTKFIDPDYRRTPKTSWSCCCCQKDIKPSAAYRMVHLVNGGIDALHPGDYDAYATASKEQPSGQFKDDCGGHPIGMDCARKLGLEWSVGQ